MARNIVLALATLAVLIVLFLGYMALISTPAAGPEPGKSAEPLPAQPTERSEPLRIGQDLELHAGGKILFRWFDERTGRPIGLFSCRDWRPITGGGHEIGVNDPGLALRLPSGMVAYIEADEGQLTADRIERSEMKPRQGTLTGNVRIIVDRETSAARAPRDERPQDLITIAMQRLEFDLERGALRTDDEVRVESDEFEITGQGLDLVWNQADNRVETMAIQRGAEFVFFAPAGLFGAVDRGQAADAATTKPEAASQPESRPARHHKAEQKITAYECQLLGGVVAEQFRDDVRVGGLEAEQVNLLFDVGSRAGQLLRPTASSPTSRPARDRSNRLAVRWGGKLLLTPAAAGEVARRLHFAASGQPVLLSRGEGSVRCARVEYHDETQRIWLEPLPGETIDFAMGKNLSATADGVYIDRVSRLVKLVGAVELRSRRGEGEIERVSTIRSSYWAELHLAEGASTTQPAADYIVTDFERLESALFVGDVRVDLGDQKLNSNRLLVRFRHDAGDRSLEKALETATATGAVRLTAGDGRVDCGELELTFDRTPEDVLYPRQMRARGAVELIRKKARVRGEDVRADLAPATDEQHRKRADLVLRQVELIGESELVDEDKKWAARGEHITALFEDVNRLTTATVSGSDEYPGLVHAKPFTVRAGKIDLDAAAQTLHVDGKSRLAFKTQRSLQGQQRGEPTAIAVTSTRLLHIDGRKNTVRFEGDVVASTEEERLESDTLTLLLEDVARPTSQPERTTWGDLWQQVRGLAERDQKPQRGGDLFAIGAGDEGERGAKEPVRLIADNALVTSESFMPGDEVPILHASVSAPLLEVDIVQRQIISTGVTQLLMTDRRGVEDAPATGDALGIPSALISRGASQTAMQCNKRMVYTLGPEGPGRKDAVVFEEGVVFVHRAGKDMVDLKGMLPQLADKPELVESMKSRNATMDCDRLECWFSMDSQGPHPQRGGALTRTPMRLASMLATGNVYLRDQQGTRIREVFADNVEFNREQGWVHVRGTDAAWARIYMEDTESKAPPSFHRGVELTVNLQDGTVRTGAIEGEMRRP